MHGPWKKAAGSTPFYIVPFTEQEPGSGPLPQAVQETATLQFGTVFYFYAVWEVVTGWIEGVAVSCKATLDAALQVNVRDVACTMM